MIKNKVCFEIKKQEKIFTLYFEQESSLGELYEVLCEMRSEIVSRIKAVEEAEKPKES